MSEDVKAEGWVTGTRGHRGLLWESGEKRVCLKRTFEEAVTCGEGCEERKRKGTGVKDLGFWKRSCYLMRRQMGSGNLGRRIY